MDIKSHEPWIQDYDAAARKREVSKRVDYFRFYKLAACARVKGPARSVLWALAHRTNSDPLNKKFGTCQVSIAGLVSMAGVSERTARRSIAELESCGIVVVEGERRGGARTRTANVYRLTLGAGAGGRIN